MEMFGAENKKITLLFCLSSPEGLICYLLKLGLGRLGLKSIIYY